MKFDGIVYCPLLEEVVEVQKVLPPEDDFSDKLGFLAYSSTCGDHRLLVTCPDQMSCSVANEMLRKIGSIYDFQ